MAETPIEEIVYDWISARATRLSCKRTMAGFSCEWQERGSSMPDDPGTPPCYLSGAVESVWCSQCQQRNRLFPGLKPLRAIERRAFNRLNRAAMRLKRAHDKSSVGAQPRTSPRGN